MKKLLFSAVITMSAFVSGYALEQGDFVYTPQGRFQITGANQNANNAFQDFTGWTVIGEEKTLADKFNINANGYADGLNSVVSNEATAGEGMYFTFVPTDAGATYVVSFKMKGAALDNTKIRIPSDGYKQESNLVKVAGNEAGTYTHPATEGEVIANTAEELTEQWQTFNYAIQGDGIPRTWYISFTTMATTIEIADLQIAPAMQYADLRQRDAMLEKLYAYKNCYEWPAEVLEGMGFNDVITNLEAIGDETGQDELDKLQTVAQEILAEFLKEKMDDFLAGGTDTFNYLGIGTRKFSKASAFGIWSCLPSGRAFWNVNDYPYFGNYAGGYTWNFNNPDSPMGVYTQMALDPGAYVFAIEGMAALREDPRSSSYSLNEGWHAAYGEAYVVKVVDGVVTDTLVSKVTDLNAIKFTPSIITAKITESGTYEFGYKMYCNDAFKELKNGSVAWVKDASIWAKTNNKYSKEQSDYEMNVRTQIAAGRDGLTKAAGYLDNSDYVWGKAALKECADSIETKIAAYEAMSQDEIIATFDKDEYTNTVFDSTGLMQYEVYQQATKWIFAANNKFIAVNDTLNSMQTVIDNAEATLAMRLYEAATGKADLQTAIDKAKGIQAAMKATDYSEKNAAAIVAANAELKEATTLFTTTIPASAITSVVDIDFEQNAVLNEETGLYSIPGAKGAMEFSEFSTGIGETTSANPFEKGYWDNGEQLWKGYLRVGNGTGTVEFNPTDNGSMGSNILKVSCDFYIQGLSGKSIGFYLKDETDTNIFGIYRNYYNGTTTDNTCDIDLTKVWSRAGSAYNNASPSDADSPTANPIEKTHFEVIMDYGRKSMYCTLNSVNGAATSKEVALDAIPVKFVLQSNYNIGNGNGRRCWFDNLKIEKYSTGLDIVQSKTGDVNNDGAINVTDVVMMIDYILQRNPKNFNEAMANVNGDEIINVTDVVLVIDAILGKIALARGAEMIDQSAYTAFQMDFTIPAGYVLEDVSLTDIAKNSHSLAYNMLANGRCRVVVFSMNKEALPGTWDEVIRLNLRGQSDAQVNIDRATFVTIGGEIHELNLNDVTAITQISSPNSQPSTIYDLQGRKVEKTSKGIFVVDGKKAVRK